MNREDGTITDALRKAIGDCDKSLGQIAADTGIDSGRLSRFARGERTLTLPAADALARYFGLKLVKARKR